MQTCLLLSPYIRQSCFLMCSRSHLHPVGSRLAAWRAVPTADPARTWQSVKNFNSSMSSLDWWLCRSSGLVGKQAATRCQKKNLIWGCDREPKVNTDCLIIDSKDLEVFQVGCALLHCSYMVFPTRMNLHASLCACALQLRVTELSQFAGWRTEESPLRTVSCLSKTATAVMNNPVKSCEYRATMALESDHVRLLGWFECHASNMVMLILPRLTLW